MRNITNFFIASPENNFRPAALSYKAFLAYGILMLLLRLLLGAMPAESAAVDSQILMVLVNEERQARNLNTLATDTALQQAAAGKAQDMIDRDYFAHVDPDGHYVWPRIDAAGYGSYEILGENLALDFLTAEGMVKAWLDSPTHRENLLHVKFRDQGLAALYGDYDGRYTNLTASLFGSKYISAHAPPAPKPTPPPPLPTPSPPPVVKSVPPATPPQSLATPTATPPAPTEIAINEPTPIEPVARRAPASGFAAPAKALLSHISTAFTVSRAIFTLIGIAMLFLLTVDSVIIHKHELQMAVGEIAISRSHSSYHLTSFMIITLISILIWWW